MTITNHTTRRYRHLTVSSEQRDVLRAEAQKRGISMATLVKEALSGRGLRLPNPGGSLLCSVGIRVTESERARYENSAARRGKNLSAWERSRLFTPAELSMKTRRQMARKAAEG